MPGTTPRGYDYPLYTDPQDTRQAIETLATDIDLDVEALANRITGALNRPSVTVSSLVNQAVAAAPAEAALTWATVDYDNDAMAALPGGIVLNDAGIYLLSARVTVNTTVTAAFTNSMTWFTSSKVFSPTPAWQGSYGRGTEGRVVQIFALHYTDGIGADSIAVRFRHDDAAGVNVGPRTLGATKVSALLTES